MIHLLQGLGPVSNAQGTFWSPLCCHRKNTNEGQACEDARIAYEDTRIEILKSVSFQFKENGPVFGAASNGKSKNKALAGVDVGGYLTVIPSKLASYSSAC